jgi:predicted ester cyclase
MMIKIILGALAYVIPSMPWGYISTKNSVIYTTTQIIVNKVKKIRNEQKYIYCKPKQQKMKTLKIKLFVLLIAATNLVCAQGLQSKTAVNKSTIEKNKDAVIRFNKAYWESGNVEIVKEFFPDYYVDHFAPRNGPPIDTILLVEFMAGFKKGFSNVNIEFHEVLGEGDKVSLIKTITATHTGDFMKKKATGKKVVINIVEIDILKDGKITDTWALSNLLQVIQAL